MRYETPRAPGALALLLMLLVGSLTGCANDAATVNRVQANLIDKDMFDGAWFVRQTVVDVPPTSGFSFVGMSGELELIRWEIRENLLVGYRAYEKVPGSDPKADSDGATVGDQPVADGKGTGYDPDVYRGSPVVAYPITAHVDVRREYNPATGEQTNVVSENTTDRPWYDRQFIRVDWTDPQTANLNFVSDALKQAAVTGSYWVDTHEKSPDAFYTAKAEDGTVNYFDFTTRLFVEPDLQLNGDQVVPACWLSGQINDCGASEVAVRTSFLKVDEERERKYEPMFYDETRQGEFGYFRTERFTYDRKYGVTEEGIQYLANRHDIWEASLDENGDTIPYKARKLRPIVYTLSENYPEDLAKVTETIVSECDQTFKAVAAAARGQTVEQLDKDLEAQTGKKCLFCLDLNENNEARIGDLRYNFLYWVDGQQIESPLGYGPSFPHPETGRIVSGNAYVYGAGVDRQAQSAADMVRLINGDVTDDDYLSGADVGRQIANRRPAIDPRTRELLRTTAIGDKSHSVLGPKVFARLQTLRAEGLPNIALPTHKQVADVLDREGLADLLITPQMRQDYAAQRGIGDADNLPPQELAKLKELVTNPIAEVKRHRLIREAAERRSITLADYSDPSLIGLAQEAKKKGLTGEPLWKYLREEIYRGVMLHELGHTFGLRHNFGASADPLNYFAEYWPLREKTLSLAPSSADPSLELLRSNCSEVDSGNKAGCDAQRAGKISEYQYSSIMDYGGRFNSDFHGFGSYDVAAIAAAYGDLVEVFDPAMVSTLDPTAVDILKEAGTINNPLFGQLGELVHYSLFPTLFNGSANIQKRKWMPRSEYVKSTSAVRVPYVGCYDEYVDARWFCHRFDQGADPYEVADFLAQSYEDDYYFISYARGRVGFGPWVVFPRVMERYFFPLTFAYQNALFDLIYNKGDEAYQRLAELTMNTSLMELWSVMSRPNYGSYSQSGGQYNLVSYTPGLGQYYSIYPGEGRSAWSRFDLDSGYNLDRRMVEAGHLYDQIAAIAALTSADASHLGIARDVVGGDLQYSIPFYLIFDEPMTQLFGSMFLEDPAGFGPRVDSQGQLILSTYEATQPDGSVVGTPVNPELPWTIRIQGLVNGFAFFRSNFNLDWAQRSQIAQVGSGDEIEVSPNYEAVRLEDPVSGRVYEAYRDPNGTGRWPAAEKIEAVNTQAEKVTTLEAELAAMPNTTPEEMDARFAKEIEVDRAKANLSNQVEEVEMLHTLYKLFGSSPF